MQLPYHNTQIRHWNPGATMPLVLPVHLVCNTSDEQLYDNVRANSRTNQDWQRLEPAHDGIAVLCGSGPSLADTLDEIRALKHLGAKVFAMNGAAKYLSDNGIYPDYQVILDARKETADLIGPAKEHLFASQVHPECFARTPNARLWHLEVGGIDRLLPEYERSYCLIGGAASVGNTATCLAYAMGYRTLHLFGYDSCHRDTSGHAFPQPMNNGDPCAVVEFNGQKYVASFTMKLQAEKFQETSRALMDAGCKINVHGSGLLPDMFRAPREVMEEQAKYEAMWKRGEYREFSPGEHCAAQFAELVRPDGLVIDFGCGTGRGSLALQKIGFEVLLVDFADNCRDTTAQALRFLKADLRQPIPVTGKYGFCCDVMEHIPPEDVDSVIRHIMACVDKAFFQISTVPDRMGSLIDQQLHLTVEDPQWWREKFTTLGYTVLWQQASEANTSLLVNKEK